MSDIPPIPKDQPVVRHRLTVVEKLYHQVDGGDANCIESNYEIQLQTDEEIYTRNLTIAELTPLDLGWLKNKLISQIVVHNKETFPAKILNIYLGESNERLLVLPGHSARFMTDSKMTLSSQAGPVKCKIQVIPG